MRRASLIFTSLLLAGVANAQSIVRPQTGYIVDRTRTISRADADAINKICRAVESRTSGEMFVAVIPSTNGQNPNRFATNVFNQWGIGDKNADNGVLVFVATKDRKAEIILGDGIDSQREEQHARDVMSDYMMPKFKQGQPSKGIRVAVKELADRYFRIGKSKVAASQPRATTSSPTQPAVGFIAENAETSSPQDFDIDHDERTESVRSTHHEHRAPEVAMQPRPIRKQPFNWFGLLFGTGATAGGVGLSYHLLTARRRPRKCEHCSQMMELLDEVNDDAHLSQAERLEEQLGSVDYDVWHCAGCSQVKKIRYGAFFTRYGRCPECRAKTSSSVTRTLQTATTISTGLKEVEESCENCDFHRVTQHVIPMRQDSTHAAGISSSSSSFSSGGGSFGGGGFGGGGGGGSSSGGGASGGW